MAKYALKRKQPIVEDTINMFKDKAKNNLGIVQMDRINRLDKKFNKGLANRKLDKNNTYANDELIGLLMQKAKYDIKYGNKKRGEKNLKKLSSFIKEPKGKTKVEKFLRSFLPDEYKYYTREDLKKHVGSLKDTIKNIISDANDIPDDDVLLSAIGISGKNVLKHYMNILPMKQASSWKAKAKDFDTLQKIVNNPEIDAISMKHMGLPYYMYAAALGTGKIKELYRKMKKKLKLSEATKDLLKHKDDIDYIDNLKLSSLDKKHKKYLEKRKVKKYLNKNDYYNDKPIKGLIANFKNRNNDEKFIDTLIKKAILDVKYGNESRGLKNLNRLLNLKTKDKEGLKNNASLFNSALNALPANLSSLDKNIHGDVRDLKQSKISDLFWSKKKPTKIAKLVDTIKNYFKTKYGSTPEAEALAEATYKKFLIEAFTIINDSKRKCSRTEAFVLANKMIAYSLKEEEGVLTPSQLDNKVNTPSMNSSGNQDQNATNTLSAPAMNSTGQNMSEENQSLVDDINNSVNL